MDVNGQKLPIIQRLIVTHNGVARHVLSFNQARKEKINKKSLKEIVSIQAASLLYDRGSL